MSVESEIEELEAQGAKLVLTADVALAAEHRHITVTDARASQVVQRFWGVGRVDYPSVGVLGLDPSLMGTAPADAGFLGFGRFGAGGSAFFNTLSLSS